MAEPRDITELLRTFDEDSDPLQVDITPSVLQLIELRLEGALAVCDLLNSSQRLIRMRARRVVEGAVFLHFGFRYGHAFPNAEAEERARAVLAENGYDSDAPEQQRREAVERWRRWLRREIERRPNERGSFGIR